jgi:hypothetical protein
MIKSIVSFTFNRINSVNGIDSISSIFLLINTIEGGESKIKFEKIIVTHDEYRIDPERTQEAKKVVEELEIIKQNSLLKTTRLHPENLKPFLNSLLEDSQEIYLVSSFESLEEINSCISWVYEIFPGERSHIFNSLERRGEKSDIDICKDNLNKFLEYIS